MASLRRAVVVGIDEYENSDKIPGLKGALNDSKEMHERLTTSGKFTIDDKHFLTGEKATSENIRRAISDLLWRTDPCELSLLYFSGHGFQDGYGNGYIAPYDLKYEEPLVRGIRIQELKEYFLASKNKERALLVLDCCHSGIATEGSKDLAEVKLPFYQSLSSLQQDAAGRGSGKFILASSGAGEKSREVRLDHFIRTPGEKTHDHGLFTFHLLEGLNGKAADENNRVTLGRLHKHVSEQMQQYKDHECTFWGSGTGLFDDTFIVESGNKRKIEERFLEVRVLLDQGDAESLFTAIASLHEAIMGSPESQEAQVLKTEIDHRLQEQCRRPISLWLMKNKLVGLCLRKFKEFQTLERLAANLCFDQIAPLESERSALLVALFQVAMESFDASVLENYLRALEPRLEPQAVTPNLGKGAIN